MKRFLIAALAAAPLASHALSVTVPGDYATIQAAVNAVQGTAGALVTINSSGTFVENVIVTQSVAIVGGTGFTPVIQPASNVAVQFSPNSATQQNFTLDNISVLGGGSNSAEIISLMAANSGDVGLSLIDVSIANPRGEVGAYGVSVRSVFPSATGVKYLNIIDSAISIDTAVNSGASGVYFGEGGEVTIRGSTISTTGAATAIDVRGNRPALFLLEDSTINVASPNGPYGATALQLIDDTASTIHHNTFNFVGNAQGSAGGYRFATRPMDDRTPFPIINF